jgi:hypothetical protein
MSYRKSEPPPGLVDAQAAYIKAEKLAEAAAADQQTAEVDRKEAAGFLRACAVLLCIGFAGAYYFMHRWQPSVCIDTAHYRESGVQCPPGAVIEVPNFDYVVCRCVRKDDAK